MSIESFALLDNDQNHDGCEEREKNEWIEETVEKESIVVRNNTCRIEETKEGERANNKTQDLLSTLRLSHNAYKKKAVY